MIQKKIVTITPFGLDRTLHLYLPEDYQSSGLTYPVMYFFDGHNLFDDRDATYGKCWGFQEYMKTATCQVILVGIECNHEGNRRLVEFCPYPVRHIHGWEDYDGRGKDLMDWLVYELKPMIDNSYPTKKDRVHTAHWRKFYGRTDGFIRCTSIQCVVFKSSLFILHVRDLYALSPARNSTSLIGRGQ